MKENADEVDDTFVVFELCCWDKFVRSSTPIEVPAAQQKKSATIKVLITCTV